MPDNKPTGPAAAAKEIMEELPIDSLTERLSETKPQSLRDIIWDRHKSVETEQAIEAIILKHCPKERRLTEWLLEIVDEILETQDPYSERGLDYSVVPKKLLQQLRAVRTGLDHCPQDKAVGLLEALEEIRDFPTRYGGILTVEAGKGAINAIAQIAQFALADYEGNQ